MDRDQEKRPRFGSTIRDRLLTVLERGTSTWDELAGALSPWDLFEDRFEIQDSVAAPRAVSAIVQAVRSDLQGRYNLAKRTRTSDAALLASIGSCVQPPEYAAVLRFFQGRGTVEAAHHGQAIHDRLLMALDTGSATTDDLVSAMSPWDLAFYDSAVSRTMRPKVGRANPAPSHQPTRRHPATSVPADVVNIWASGNVEWHIELCTSNRSCLLIRTSQG